MVDIKYKEYFSFARYKLNENNLYDWTISINNRKSSLGIANENKKIIYLSRYLLDHFPPEKIKDTILHEIAHAIDFETRGYSKHDYHWKLLASRVGATPKARYYDVHGFLKNVPTKYTYVCTHCGYSAGISRKLKNIENRYCGLCYKKEGIKPKFKIIKNW